MIPAGTSLVHARSGDRFIFLSDGDDWRAERLKLRMHLTPGHHWAPRHYHTEYDEILRVESGSLVLQMSGARSLVTPEDGTLLIPRGVVHAFWNESESPTTLFAELTPCFELARGILAAYGMARDGTSSRFDLPYHPLDLGLLLRLLKSHSPWLPLAAQQGFGALCERAATWLGRAADFPEHQAEHWPREALAPTPPRSTLS